MNDAKPQTQRSPRQTAKEGSRAAPRRKRRWLRRLLAACVVLFFSLACLATLVVLRPGWIVSEEWLLERITATLSEKTKRDVEIGHMELPRLGRVKLENVVIKSGKEPHRPPLMRAKSFTLYVKILPLLRGQLIIKRLTFREPRFFFDTDYLTKMKFSGRPPKADEIMGRLAVEQLLIESANLAILDAEGNQVFSVTHFDMSAAGAQYQPLDYTMGFHIEGLGIAGEVRSGGTLTAFRDSGHRFDVGQLTFQSGPLQAHLSGTIANEKERPNLSLSLTADGDLEALRRLLNRLSVPIPDDIAVKGNSTLRVKFSGTPTDITVDGAVDVPEDAVSYAGERLMRWPSKSDLTFLVRVQEDRIDLKGVKITSSLGETTLSGTIKGTTKPTVDLQVETRASLGKNGKNGDRPHILSGVSVSGELTSSLHVSGPAANPKVKGDLNLDAVEVKRGKDILKKRGERARSAVDLSIHKGVVEIGPGTVADTSLGTLGVTGSIESPGRTPILKLDLSAEIDANACLSRLPEEQRKPLARLKTTGKAIGKAKLEGTVSDFNLAGKLDLNALTVDYDGHPILKQGSPAAISADLRLTESEATLNSVEISTEPAVARIRGRISNLKTQPRPDLEFDIRGRMEKLVAEAVEYGAKVIPEDVTLTGDIKVTGSAKADPQGTVKIVGEFNLADCEARFKDVVLKSRRYEPDMEVDVLVFKDRIALDRLFYRSEAMTLSGSGTIRNDGTLAMDLSSDLHLGEFRPLIEAGLREGVSGVDTSAWPPEEVAILQHLPEDMKISGTLSTKFGCTVALDDIHAHGSIDASAVQVNYRGVPLARGMKKPGLDFDVHADKKKVTVSQLALRSDAGTTHVTGEIALGEKPMCDLDVRSEFVIEQWLAGLPLKEIDADERVSKLLDRYGVQAQMLWAHVNASGTASSGVNVQGNPEAVRVFGFLDLDKVDLRIRNSKGRELIRKAAGTHAKVGFDAGKRGGEYLIEVIRVEHDDDAFSAKGRIVLSQGRVSTENLLVDVNGDRSDVALDVELAKNHVTIHRATLKHDKNSWELHGKIDCTEDEIRVDDFNVGVNDSKMLIDLRVKDYTEPGPEIHVLMSSPILDVRPVIPAIPLAPSAKPPAAETDMQLTPETMPKELETFLRKAKLDLKLFIGDLAFDIDDKQDRDPGMRRCEPRNVSVDVQLRDGVCHAAAKAVLNEGMGDLDWTMDFNGDLTQHNVTYWADAVQANDNLRPFMNFTFNNLYVHGDIGFDGSASWQGLSGHNIFRTMHGKTKMYINDGYMLGKAAPEYMIALFPWLNLGNARWGFKEGHIVSVTEGTTATNNMRFRYPGSTYMNGTTNNITKQISYVFGVDLVDSFGLGDSTGIMSEGIENKSSIDLCRYVGTIDDQKVEWFKLRGDEMMGLLKRLLQIQTFATIFSPRKTPMEKFRYIEGRAVNVIVAPVRAGKSVVHTPERIIQRVDTKKIERVEP